VVGLVGESGSGKSITAFSLMGLLPHGANLDGGSIVFDGQELSALQPAERRNLCGLKMGMVFQEPLTALNPVIKIGEQIAEIFRYRQKLSSKQAWDLAVKLLAQVGLPNPRQAAESYPHRFSGGMRQRVVISMALALNPKLVIADEPTTALDPTIASQIVRLLKTMAQERKSAVLFITHNLRLLTNLAERLLVMYAGYIVEQRSGDFSKPLHPYTIGLMKALPPAPSQQVHQHLEPIPGQPPSPSDEFQGCPFHPRCQVSIDDCDKIFPALTPQSGGDMVRCHRYAKC
jgi:oligopeptide transport system ATP-binding protein